MEHSWPAYFGHSKISAGSRLVSKAESDSQPAKRRHLALHHFHHKVTDLSSATTPLPHTRHKFWITISKTSSKFKVLSADIWENSSSDSPDARQTARISHLNCTHAISFFQSAIKIYIALTKVPYLYNIGLLTLTIVKSNVRSPIESSTKKKLTNQLLVSEWSWWWSIVIPVYANRYKCAMENI